MTKYCGVKALDAEIKLDFIKGEVVMDYTLNKYGSLHRSNNSTTINSEWRKLPYRKRCAYALFDIFVLKIPSIIVAIYMMFFTELVNRKIITDPKAHYEHQNLVRWYFSRALGTVESTVNGNLKSKIHTILIRNNIWVDYKLEGDYEKNLKSVSLVRHFTRFRRYGKFLETRQDGWNVVFEFEDIPLNGSCVVTHIR